MTTEPLSNNGTPPKAIYDQLAAPFPDTFKDVRGGVELEYITGEQCISRLNDVLGVGGWSFAIREHGIHDGEEVWVRGSLLATIHSQHVEREQFGSQRIKRSRTSGQPLDIGFDLKGAATDCLKKCAMTLGVGLYLSRKEPQHASEPPERAPQPTNGATPKYTPQGDSIDCEECGKPLDTTRFRDGTVWTPDDLRRYGQRKHNKTLCMEHYRTANEARRAAERRLEEAPF